MVLCDGVRTPGRSPLESRHDLPVARSDKCRSRIDASEAGDDLAIGYSLRRGGVGRIGRIQIGPIERIEKLGANLERHSFTDGEYPAETQ